MDESACLDVLVLAETYGIDIPSPLPGLLENNSLYDEIPIILIRDNKTWEEALDYCREHHEDLASVHNEDIQKWVQKRAEQADGPYVWLGLRYTCTLEFWFWVNEEPMCYQNWSPGNQNGDCEMSGAMETGGNHSWVSLSDARRFNFICSTGDMGEGDMGAPQCHTCDR
ncbi:snaclec rhodocytin subunit alpha-like [Diretmus argenteus]